MKPQFVSAAAMLFCCAIVMVVGLFGYSRYKAAQSANAAFGAQLQSAGQDQQAVLGTHMPEQLPPRGNPEEASPTPQR
jgi:hypothetical protein